MFIAAQNDHSAIVERLIKAKTHSIPFISTVDSLNAFATHYGEDIISRMHKTIDLKQKQGATTNNIAIFPYEIAEIMGHQHIVNILKPLEGVDISFSEATCSEDKQQENGEQNKCQLPLNTEDKLLTNPVVEDDKEVMACVLSSAAIAIALKLTSQPLNKTIDYKEKIQYDRKTSEEKTPEQPSTSPRCM